MTDDPEAIRELIRDLHAATKDARATLREIKATMTDLGFSDMPGTVKRAVEIVMDDARSQLKSLVTDATEGTADRMTALVERGIAHFDSYVTANRDMWARAMTKAMDAASEAALDGVHKLVQAEVAKVVPIAVRRELRERDL